MSSYHPPIRDIRFVLRDLAGLDEIASLPGYGAATPDLVDAVLEEAGRFAADVIAPLNQPGDREGSRLVDGQVRTPKGWKEAYSRFADGGWQSLTVEEEYGGQGLPWVLSAAVMEMWQGASLSFGLAPLLTQGAIEAVLEHGSAEQKALFLPRMVAGTWTGTMNLTEPQAGSDLSQVRMRAVPAGDGTYRLTGQKIFITYGDHDLAENIVHLVLARLPDAPAGTKGISLFIVPKFMVEADGTPGARNDVRCASLEHKLGIHASPTAVMAFGDSGGAVGYLVGEANRGLEYMFTMMNNARLNVGLQGVAIAERAYQLAHDYARQRVQGRDAGGAATIIRHPDVRRMLLTMKAKTEAGRGLAYFTMAQLDLSRRHPDPARRALAQALVDLLTPVVKAWGTEIGCQATDLGIQIHGGMGFIEETGAAQLYRDARILPIYEGTNGIQALDLVGRKILRDRGAVAETLFGYIDRTVAEAAASPADGARNIGNALADSLAHLRKATRSLIEGASDATYVGLGADPYLRLFGVTAGGWMLARAALAAEAGRKAPEVDGRFYDTKLKTAGFYAAFVMPEAVADSLRVTHGARSAVLPAEEDLSSAWSGAGTA